MTSTSEQPTIPPVWQQSRDYFQSKKGVHRPHAFEISPMQYALMPKSRKAAYDAKRSKEWQASGDCEAEYREQCFAAYLADPSILKHSALARDAKDAIWVERMRADEVLKAQQLEAAGAANRIDPADVKVGDRVFWIGGSSYGYVSKKNRVSVILKLDHGFDMKTSLRACEWLHYRELLLAIAAGKSPQDFARELMDSK